MNGSLKSRITHWKERFEALSIRERVLFLAAIIAVLYMTWDMLLMKRVRSQQKNAVVQISKWQKQIAEIDGRIQTVTASFNGSKQQEAARRIVNLTAEISEINKRQKALAVGFIAPTQMVAVLKGLLREEKGLQLTRLQSQGAEPLIQRPAQRQADSGSATPGVLPPQKSQGIEGRKPAADTGDSTAPPLPEVYKHGLEIVFQGDYRSTLSYLKKLEGLPWKFYWDEVVYEVVQYPKAQISVRIHTLSLDKGWISV